MALDPDTFTSPKTLDAARMAAGAAVRRSITCSKTAPGTRVCAGAAAGPSRRARRAMGFCFFNNIAMPRRAARARGLSRVAIVDYDVHHGNGTQWSFYDDPSVLFISSHQYPYYPGTGAAATSARAGPGFTVNLPLSAGATDADYEVAYPRRSRCRS